MLKVLSLLLCEMVLVITRAPCLRSDRRLRFELKRLPFQLESDESDARNAPETMLGGVAICDDDGDGRPDKLRANIATLKQD